MTETGSTATRGLPRRSDLTIDQTWNLESVFATNAAWEQAYEDVMDRLEALEPWRGRTGASAANMLAALRMRDSLQEEVEKILVYAYLRRAEDATNDESAALAERAGNLEARLGAAAAYIEPEILALDSATIDRYLTEEPELAEYRHYFDQLGRMRNHVRSAEVEELLAEADNVMLGFPATRSALENADLDLGTIQDANGNEVQLGQGNLHEYLSDHDREVRKAAWISAADAYLGMRNTFAGTLAGGIKRNVFQMRARRFGSSLEASLFPNAIPTEVFHNLIDTVWKNLPVWHRYFALRKRILGLDVHHEWDITAHLTTEGPHISSTRGWR